MKQCTHLLVSAAEEEKSGRCIDKKVSNTEHQWVSPCLEYVIEVPHADPIEVGNFWGWITIAAGWLLLTTYGPRYIYKPERIVCEVFAAS